MKTSRRNEFCTIYLLTNTENLKKYIGQTWYDLKIRMGKDGENYKNSIYLYNAIKYYGVEKFEYTVLQECTDQNSADAAEELFINQYNTRNLEIGYNLKSGGSHGLHSDATREKISNTQKEICANMTPEEIAIKAAPISGYWEGRIRGPHTEEHREQVIKTLQPGSFAGHSHSDETKAAIGKSSVDMWAAGKMTPEAIKRGAEKRQMSKEKERQIIDAYLRGDTFASIKTTFKTNANSIYRVLERNNISLTEDRNINTGRKHTEETKQKQSKVRAKYWEDKKTENEIQEEIQEPSQKEDNRLMSKEKEQEIINAFKNGDSFAKIKNNLGVGFESIYRVLERNNIPSGRERRGKAQELKNEIKEGENSDPKSE